MRAPLYNSTRVQGTLCLPAGRPLGGRLHRHHGPELFSQHHGLRLVEGPLPLGAGLHRSEDLLLAGKQKRRGHCRCSQHTRPLLARQLHSSEKKLCTRPY